MLDSNYLEKIASKSANHVNEKFGFSKFDDINIYLINSALEKKYDLWLDVSKIDLESYYQPIVFALVVNFLEKNVSRTYNLRSNLNTNVRVGKKYEKGKKIYEVTEVMTDNDGREKVKLQCTAKGSDEITICYLEYFDEYVEIDKDAGSRPTLLEMGKLMKDIGYNKIIASYAHKFAIVCSKKHFIDSFTNISLKALPYEYITRTEKLKPNRPLKDFMFFVTTDYEAIQEYVFDEEEIDLDLIIFFGSRSSQQVNSDLARGSVKQVIYINDEKPKADEIVKWKWTPPELQYFKTSLEESFKNPICVVNKEFEELKVNFVNFLDEVSTQNRIDLDYLYPYFTYLYSIVILSQNSRLNNKINDLSDRVNNIIENRLFQDLKSIGQDPEPIIDKLSIIYADALKQLSLENNAKTRHLKEMVRTDFLLVPSEQTLDVWKRELNKIGWRNTQTITINKLQNIDQKSSVTVIAIKDLDLFKKLFGGIHDVQWLLYGAEYIDFKSYKTKYNNELIKELKSPDRKKLTGIDFPIAEQDELPSDMITRIIEQRSHGLKDFKINEFDHIEKRIIFTDGTEIVRSINSSLVWLDKQKNDKAVKYLVGDLRPDDTVRVYENTHKDKLFEILSESDEDGEFKKILDHSHQWKKELKNYCTTEDRFTEIAEKCEVAVSTVKLWLRKSSNTKFPQEMVGLVDLLGDDFDSILESKENFGSISIAIGRDLADDVTDYIISGHREIGPTLNQFDFPTINKIAEQNMQTKVIEKIITLND